MVTIDDIGCPTVERNGSRTVLGSPGLCSGVMKPDQWPGLRSLVRVRTERTGPRGRQQRAVRYYIAKPPYECDRSTEPHPRPLGVENSLQSSSRFVGTDRQGSVSSVARSRRWEAWSMSLPTTSPLFIEVDIEAVGHFEGLRPGGCLQFDVEAVGFRIVVQFHGISLRKRRSENALCTVSSVGERDGAQDVEFSTFSASHLASEANTAARLHFTSKRSGDHVRAPASLDIEPFAGLETRRATPRWTIRPHPFLNPPRNHCSVTRLQLQYWYHVTMAFSLVPNFSFHRRAPGPGHPHDPQRAPRASQGAMGPVGPTNLPHGTTKRGPGPSDHLNTHSAHLCRCRYHPIAILPPPASLWRSPTRRQPG